MITRVYVWQGSISAKSFGHISLELSDGTYISWWPAEKMSSYYAVFIGGDAKCFDNFESELEANQNQNPTKTLHMRGINEKKVVEYYKRLLDGSMKWDLMERSCSNIVYAALCEGSEWFKGRAGKTTTPMAVAELVEAYIGNKKDKQIKIASLCK